MKPISIFFISVVVMTLVLFLLPVNLFDGEIVYESGLQVITDKAPLGLYSFIGLYQNPEDMAVVKSFRLLPTGYLMAVIFIFGFPALLAYRIHLSRLKKKDA